MSTAAELGGQVFGHYRIIRPLGAGGMSVVYEAEDLTLGRHVALKFLSESLSRDPGALERFRREARAASVLNHPNVCTIYEVHESSENPFIAMELLEGCTLKDWIKGDRSPSDLGQFFDIAIQIAEGLAASHAKGIIHRDIKPSNVFLTVSGLVKVLDFGLAKTTFVRDRLEQQTNEFSASTASLASGENDLTRAGSTLGTVAYMSPEQVRGEALDVRSDLFSLGVVLYEMSTGTLPFHAETLGLIFDGILNRIPVPPSRINPKIPQELDDLISKALKKNKEERYESAAELRANLERLRHEGVPERSQTKTMFVVGIATLTMLVVVALYLSSRSGIPATERSKSTATAPTSKPSSPILGTVTVDTNVDDAEILVDGQRQDYLRGLNPWKITLPAGNHEIMVEKEGYQSASVAIKVVQDFETETQLTLLPTKMQLTPLPRSDVERIRNLLEVRYAHAWETQDVGEALAIWPGVSRDVQNTVRVARGIKMKLQCNPLAFGDTALAKCDQTVSIGGNSKTGGVVFKLKKVSGNWQIEGSEAP